MNASVTTSLLTDMYELTMIDAALQDGTALKNCVFELFGRRLPSARRYGVMAGNGRIADALERFRFSPADIDFLAGREIVSAQCLDYLRDFRFQGTIRAYREGECYFDYSPLLQVEGTFAECVALETLLLSILNHDCAIASAASRCTIAAHGRPCFDMGARRTHERAAISAARAAYVGGFAGTSSLEAGQRYNIPVIGTSAHAFTLLHDTEEAAFKAQISNLGPATTVLVDTYDVKTAVETAVRCAREAGGELGAVRLDSGDLLAEAFKVRSQLDSLNAHSTQITVTSDLDEYAIASLGVAPVDSYGVGTKLVTGSGIPTAALVYKLVQVQEPGGIMRCVAKKSRDKATVGGRKYPARLYDETGTATTELIVMADNEAEAQAYLQRVGAKPLYVEIVTRGEINPTVNSETALGQARDYHLQSRNALPYPGWRLSSGEPALPTQFVDLRESAPRFPLC